MKFFIFSIIILLIYPLNQIILKFNYLPSQTGDKHQSFLGKVNVPLTGGLFILMFILLLFPQNIYLNSFLILFFILGIASDKNYISSPLFRFIIQAFFIFLFVLFFDLKIQDLRNEILTEILENNIFSYLFVILCFLVLINGSNFIDGLNGLQLGYYLIVFLILIKNDLLAFSGFTLIETIIFVFSITYILILNFKNKLFMGDSGSYVISLFVGFTLINVYNNSVSISPFFIALLLWYPCFENLFSIIRKFNFKLSPLKPDNKHLHHLIYINLKRKYKLSKNLSNNISSMIINFFNLIILLIGSLNTHHTLTQLLLIVLIIIIYTKTYLTLLKKYSTSRI